MFHKKSSKEIGWDVIGYAYELGGFGDKYYFDIYEVMSGGDVAFRLQKRIGKIDLHDAKTIELSLRNQGMKSLSEWTEQSVMEHADRTHQMKRLQLYMNGLSLHQLKILEVLVRSYLAEPNPEKRIPDLTTFLTEVETQQQEIQETKLYQKLKKK